MHWLINTVLNKQENQQMKESGHSSASEAFFARLLSVFPCFGPRKKSDPLTDISSCSVSAVDGFTVNSPSVNPAALRGNGGALAFTMEDLHKATSNFSHSCVIGQGGFGTIYKGRLTDGTLVAIKRAKKGQFESRLSDQFQSEVNMLASIDHLNLVKLIGYFEGGSELILVEEYVPNGNLRQHLDCLHGKVLDLYKRLDIAIDIAHALTYLHLYADHPIIHRDVKASNILLTENFRAKVADFGFSRLGPVDSGATHVLTQVKGTAGYLDPEYIKSYRLTTKSDVYSFGILLVELLTGRRPIEESRSIDERITVRWAYDNFVNGNLVEILDPKLEKTESTYEVMDKMLDFAFQCSAPVRRDRPSMKEAGEYLWKIRREAQSMQQQNESPHAISLQRNI